MAGGRGKGEAAFDELVVHLVVKAYEQVWVEVRVAGLEIDEDVYQILVVVVKRVDDDVVNFETRDPGIWGGSSETRSFARSRLGAFAVMVGSPGRKISGTGPDGQQIGVGG